MHDARSETCGLSPVFRVEDGARCTMDQMRAPWLSAMVALALAGAPRQRAVRCDDLTPELRRWLDLKAGCEDFDAWRGAIERSTAKRLREGESDELAYFLLQSASFTREPRIEPAASARQYVESLPLDERERYLKDEAAPAPGRVPTAVCRRMDDLLRALQRPGSDQRLEDFRTRGGMTRESLMSAYHQAMRFLYRKEFEGGRTSLYQERGHSTDTRMESNYAVWTALSVLKAIDPAASFSNILIIGPGLDFAPRTALFDRVPPQSYQPFAVADALLSTGAAAPGWRMHSVDINDRVIRFLDTFPSRKDPRLVVLKGAAGDEYDRWFERAGEAIGRVRPIEGGKSIAVRAGVAERMTASKLNILTERYEPSPGYDLAIATNVFVYFSPAELALAMANIRSMMKDGGYLIHNELRAEMDLIAQAAGFAPVQARTLRFSGDLYDAFAIHRAGR